MLREQLQHELKRVKRGECLAVLCPDLDLDQFKGVNVRRVRHPIIRPYQVDGHQIVTDVRIGISIAPIDGTESGILLKNADMALYGARADGRGTYRFFEPEINMRTRGGMIWKWTFARRSIIKEFELYYQPLQTNEISAFEALLRRNLACRVHSDRRRDRPYYPARRMGPRSVICGASCSIRSRSTSRLFKISRMAQSRSPSCTLSPAW